MVMDKGPQRQWIKEMGKTEEPWFFFKFFLRNHYSYSAYLDYDEGLQLPGCPGWPLFLHAGQSLPLKNPQEGKKITTNSRR